MRSERNGNRKIRPSRFLLEKLYIQQHLSSYEIARRLGCDSTTVRNWLRTSGVPIRTALESFRYRIYRTPPGRLSYAKKDFDGDAATKAYLIGFRLGDLTVAPVNPGMHSRTLKIQCRTTRPEQARLFERLFSRYGHIHTEKPDRAGGFQLIAYVNRSFNFLLPKQDAVDQVISNNLRCATAFAAGYIDAEGSFHITTRRKTGLKKAVFALASQDQHILQWCHQWLLSIGADCRPPKIAIHVGTPRRCRLNKDYWILQVHRKDALLKLIEALRPWIKHPKRTADMLRVLANIRIRNAHPRLKFAPRKHRAWAGNLLASL